MMLTGKVALVTGAGQGVGQGIAFALAKHGARVGVTGRTAAKLESTCKEIESRGGEALPVQANVKDAKALAACVDAVVSHFGGLQILVNNAQEVPLGPLLAVDDESFGAGWESGPLATHRLMRLCYPHLKGDGCIINLATTAERRWDASNYGHYAAVKAAIRALTRAAASEWGGDGIRANVIIPGFVSQRPAANEQEEQIRKQRGDRIPVRRLGEWWELGPLCVYLASDASKYVTGHSFIIDGGGLAGGLGPVDLVPEHALEG